MVLGKRDAVLNNVIKEGRSDVKFEQRHGKVS